MDYIKKLKNKDLIIFTVVISVILFVCINTAEAKKLLSYVLTVLSPLIYGIVIAFILNIFTKVGDNGFKKIYEKKGKKYDIKKHRLLSIILSVLVFLLFVVLTVVLIIPSLKNTINSLSKEAPELWDKVVAFVDSLKVKYPKFEGIITSAQNSIDGSVEKLMNNLKGNIGKIAGSALSTIKSASNVVINFLLGLLIAFGLVYKKEELVKEYHAIVDKTFDKKTAGRIYYVLSMANEKFQIYFKFNFVQAGITGAGTLLFMLVCRMPHALSIALLITVTQLVPIVGAIVGTVVGALLILPTSLFKAILFVILCILVQQLVEKIINPHLMGKELDMPGLLTFLVICIGGKQFGLVGLFCAVPAFSVLYDVYRFNIRPKLYEKKESISKSKE